MSQDTATSLTNRSIDLSFELAETVLQNPSVLDDIPNGVTLILLPANDPELVATKITRGLEAVKRGENVYFRHTGISGVVAPSNRS